MIKVKKDRSKKRIAEMMPVKEWFTASEACAYLDTSLTNFNKISVENGLTISMIGSKRYFSVKEIQSLFTNNLIIERV